MAQLASFVILAVISETYGQTGLTSAQKQQFVNAHNTLRRSVRPPATNMLTMVYVVLGHACGLLTIPICILAAMEQRSCSTCSDLR